MNTKENKNLLAVGIFLFACFIALCFSTSIHGGQKYQVRPEITLPEYRTDADRAIDAYERMMDRFMSMTERNLIDIDNDVKRVNRQLTSINGKLSELSVRIANIEKKLNYKHPARAVKNTPPVRTEKCSNKPEVKIKDQP
jgi:peptidoglycan hydrolase CwlO-like protein